MVGLVFLSEGYARSSGPGGWLVADPDSNVGTLNGVTTFGVFGGSDSRELTTLGVGGSGFEIPRDFSISTERPFRMNEYSREMGVVGR